MPKTLPENYQANLEILKENLRRGLEPCGAIKVINGWRNQFTSAGVYGEAEVSFINSALEIVEEYTHIKVVEVQAR